MAASTTTLNPVEQVKQAVKSLNDQKAELEKQIANIDKQLAEIATAIKGKPGSKPRAKDGPGHKTTPVSNEDKKKLLDAMKEIGGKMRSGKAFKKAGLTKSRGKKAMKALQADGEIKVKGPWVSVA